MSIIENFKMPDKADFDAQSGLSKEFAGHSLHGCGNALGFNAPQDAQFNRNLNINEQSSEDEEMGSLES